MGDDEVRTEFGRWSIHAGSRRLANGRFAPRAVLTEHVLDRSVDHELVLPLPDQFDEARDAAAHALQRARSWALAQHVVARAGRGHR